MTLITSCSEFLNVLPKGQRIPQTLADYEALIRDESNNMTENVAQALYLMNDQFMGIFAKSYDFLGCANYTWDESKDRIELNKTDEPTFYGQYRAISNCNLILEHYQEATQATESEKREVAAYATVLRAMSYYTLVNYYCDAYTAATADNTSGIPLIESANINAPYKQVSVGKIYNFITTTVEAVLGDLPTKSMTILHPSKGAAYALLARVYLQMGDYEKALGYANSALKENNELYDWVTFYNTYKEDIEDPESYTNLPGPMGYEYVENYNYRHGPNYWPDVDPSIPIHRAERFEDGDAKAAARWKYINDGMEEYMIGITIGYINFGGMTTVEVYLIKAECLARAGKLNEAMDVLDIVRKTRILPEYYIKLNASTLDEAITLIMRTKANELIQTIVPFADAKRLNAEGKWPVSLVRTDGGVEQKLSPNSHLWTMPFPNGAISISGNGTLTQNVSK